jgi:sterol 3beta-glucosyltransferase
MRLTAIAFGTRGDVIPVVALAARLQAEGQTIRVASHAEFEDLVRRHGLDFHPVPGSFEQRVATKEGRHSMGVPTNSPLGLRGLYSPFVAAPEAVFRACWEAASDAEGLIASTLAAAAAGLVAAKRALPFAVGMAVPVFPTTALQYPSFPAHRPARPYNRLTWRLGTWLVSRGAAPIFRAWEREADRLRPGPLSPPRAIALVAVSPRLVPRPADWPGHAHLTGFWFGPSVAPPVDENLRHFVESGTPPLVLGFGSMADDDPAALRRIVLDALASLQMRAVVVSGSGGALFGFDGEPSVHETRFADYRWLFQRVAAVVHQGGVGTASYALSAGTPHVIVPYCLDHAFWASRLEAIGVAPPPIGRHRLTPARLRGTIRRVLEDHRYREAASALAPAIREERGLDDAVALVKAHFGISRSADG